MNDQPTIRFRVAGMLQRENKILFQRNKKGDAWVLPGGGIEVRETSIQTIEREFQEELGWRIRVSRLICIIENFNAYEHDGLHEIGLYYELVPDEEIPMRDGDFKGIEPSMDLAFRWISIDELEQHKIYPRVLKGVLRHIPDEVKHFINDDINANALNFCWLGHQGIE